VIVYPSSPLCLFFHLLSISNQFIRSVLLGHTGRALDDMQN
jgi:hypothetical protein